MAYLNSIDKLPKKGDKVTRVEVGVDRKVADITFSNGKVIVVHVTDTPDDIESKKDKT